MIYIDSLEKNCPRIVVDGIIAFLHYRFHYEIALLKGNEQQAQAVEDLPSVEPKQLMRNMQWKQGQQTRVVRYFLLLCISEKSLSVPCAACHAMFKDVLLFDPQMQIRPSLL